MEFLGGISLLLILVLAIIYMERIIDVFAYIIYSLSYFFADVNDKTKDDSDDSLGNVEDSV